MRRAPTAAAVIVGAGAGSRFGSETPKQLLPLEGKPLLAMTVARFRAAAVIDQVILVLPREGFEAARDMMIPHAGDGAVEMVPGGDSRQASVWEGLRRVRGKEPGRLVAVHDGARPLVEPDLIARVVEAAFESGGAVAAVAVVETLKEVSEEGTVLGTVDRRRFYRAQTPQCFSHEVLKRAFEKAIAEGFLGTDDAALVERLGSQTIRIVPGSERNIKVTTPEDFALVEYYLKRAREGS